jgi:exodeoxyribonuclease III
MSYNILEGGNLWEGDRTDLLFEIIKSFSPDILGLNECRGFSDDDYARLRLFERQLGMSGVLSKAQSGNDVAILHRTDLPVVEISGRSSSMYNGYARITLETTELGSVAVVATHLQPYSSLFRTGEMQIVAVRAAAAKAAIIMGDMNSVAPSDVRTLDLTDAPRTMIERLRGVSGDIDTEVVSVPLNRGYVDLGQKDASKTYPTILLGERSNPRVRLDYMFASPPIAERCTSFHVADNAAAHRASDHLPIMAELDLSLTHRSPGA